MSCKITLDTRRADRDGKYPIVITVRNKNMMRIPTGYKASLDNWDGDRYNTNEANYRKKNIMINDMYIKVDRFTLEMEENNTRMSDSDFRDEILHLITGKERKKDKCFIHFIEEFANKKTGNTRQAYMLTRDKVELFDEEAKFDTIDGKWLVRFESFLREAGNKINTIGIHMRNIRAVFNYCIDEEYTTSYPFRRYQIKKEETRKRSLSVSEIATLRDYPCEPHQEKYRDIFMLMFYLMGINAVDLLMAKDSDVRNGRLEYKRAKTGRLYSILIEPEAEAIINRYKGENYLLNIMDEYSNYKDFVHRMNLNLREIGEMERKGLGGKKIRKPLFPDISTYYSRHSWASIAAELDIPKETIAHALGHAWANSTTTDIYIKFNEKKIDEANRKVIDFLDK